MAWKLSFSQEQSALQTILGTNEAPVVVEVRGEEMDEIENVVNQVKQKMLGMDELFNVQSSIENGAPEVEIKIDRMRAGVYNINVQILLLARFNLSWKDRMLVNWNPMVKWKILSLKCLKKD